MIVDADGELYRVQCKTAWRMDNGTIRFNTHSQTTTDGEHHETGYEGEIVSFVVRFPEDDSLYWVDIEDAASRKMMLRYIDTIDHPSINWAEDFELGEEIPRRS